MKYAYDDNHSFFDSLYLVLSILLAHLRFRFSNFISLWCQIFFLFLFLYFGFLLRLLSALVLGMPIFSLHFFFDGLFLFSEVSSHFEHLLVWLIHLYKVISGPFILDAHQFKLSEDKLRVVEGNSIRMNLSCWLIVTTRQGICGSMSQVLMNIVSRRFVFNFFFDAVDFSVSNKILFSAEH